MKKTIVFLLAVALSAGFVFSQSKNSKAVVMYFKADLACCPARACGTLENDVKAIVEQNFKDGNVVFNQIRISDPANAELVKKYEAKSQTVVVVVSKKKAISSVDATNLVRDFRMNQDKAAFETAFVKLIKDSMK
jgi:hypothetical protein